LLQCCHALEDYVVAAREGVSAAEVDGGFSAMSLLAIREARVNARVCALCGERVAGTAGDPIIAIPSFGPPPALMLVGKCCGPNAIAGPITDDAQRHLDRLAREIRHRHALRTA
jgi:hypothetical protein